MKVYNPENLVKNYPIPISESPDPYQKDDP